MSNDPDRAMNLSQHAARTGYSREQLARFRPLLIGGKIRPSELDRHIYDYRKVLMDRLSPAAAGLIARPEPASQEPEATDRWRLIERKFHGLDTKSARSASCNARAESRQDTSA